MHFAVSAPPEATAAAPAGADAVAPDARSGAEPGGGDGSHLVDASSLADGGVQRYLGRKHRWLQAMGWRHTIVTPHGHGPGIVACGGAPWGGRRIVIDRGAAQRLIERAEPDLVEVADTGQLAWAALGAARRRRIPAVACCLHDLPSTAAALFGGHGGREPAGARWARRRAAGYLRRLYERFDLVLAPSRATADTLRELGLARVCEQGLGVDSTLFAPSQRDPRWRWRLERHLGLEPGSKLLLYAGSFGRDKNLPLLAQAVERLGRGYCLLACGTGPCPPPAGAQVRVLAPQRDERLARLVANVDGLVHAGERETFGLAALEAMACGTPVAVSDRGALPELVDGAGLVVPGRDAGIWAGAMRALVDAPSRWTALGRTRALAHDWTAVWCEWEQHYLDLLLRREGQTLPGVAAQGWRAGA